MLLQRGIRLKTQGRVARADGIRHRPGAREAQAGVEQSSPPKASRGQRVYQQPRRCSRELCHSDEGGRSRMQ